MPKTKGLTVKQRLFVRELKKTLSPTEAAMRAYNCKDRVSAANIASENLGKLGISMNELMDKMGLTTEQDVADLHRLRKAQKLQVCDIYVDDENGTPRLNKNSNDFIEVDDNHTQLKALELTLKMKGALRDKATVEINVKQTFQDIKIEGSTADELIKNINSRLSAQVG